MIVCPLEMCSGRMPLRGVTPFLPTSYGTAYVFPSGVKGRWHASSAGSDAHGTCLTVHRKRGRMRGGTQTGRCFVVLPCQERTIVKGTRLCFLSQGTVYSCFVCNLWPPRSCTAHRWRSATHLSRSSCAVQIVAYFHTVGTIVATLECLLSELD